MSMREYLTDVSKGDRLSFFWRLYRLRAQFKNKLVRGMLTFLLNRSARRHGGYVGPGAVFSGIPSLPHGLHGVYISRYAAIGAHCRIYQNVTIGEIGGHCRIYQNVTIGEIGGHAPVIGDHCLIGAGAVLVGGIRIGNHVSIGAGAVVHRDIPDHCTVVAQPPRILERGETHDLQ